MIRARVDSEADYASNVEPPTFPEGFDCEVFTVGCLRRLDEQANAAYLREHVTALTRERPDLFRIARVAADRDLSWIRLTVDVPADLARVERLLTKLPSSPPPDLTAIVAAFESDPSFHDQSGLPLRNERYYAQREAASQQRATE